MYAIIFISGFSASKKPSYRYYNMNEVKYLNETLIEANKANNNG